MQRAEDELVAIYGERYRQYRRDFQRAGEMEYEPYFPLYIMPEQTYRCNLRCISCIHGYPKKRRQFDMDKAFMPWDLYERIVLEGEEHGCPSIATHNNDEPLLLKDLPQRIEFARVHGFMDVIMTTNGILFDEDKIKQVINAGVTRLLFSIDALTEDTYNRVRPGGNFSKVLRALDTALNYREKRNSDLPIIRVSFVPNRINQHELQPFFEKFSKIVDYIDVQPFCTYYDENKTLIPERAEHVIDYCCSCPWRYAIVRADGDVLPCPNFYGAELVMGNMYKNTLYDIFNSESMKILRQQFKEEVYSHSACVACSQSAYTVTVNLNAGESL
jgi:radical SAM protein with 4Fe4S-binding SPASM domain